MLQITFTMVSQIFQKYVYICFSQRRYVQELFVAIAAERSSGDRGAEFITVELVHLTSDLTSDN